jgi:hypothetical protein
MALKPAVMKLSLSQRIKEKKFLRIAKLKKNAKERLN